MARTDALAPIEAELRATGLPWVIERGARHHKIKLTGRLVGIAPGTGRDTYPRALKNVLAQIRRAAREMNV